MEGSIKQKGLWVKSISDLQIKIIFLISQPNHVGTHVIVLIAPKLNVKNDGFENNQNFTLKII